MKTLILTATLLTIGAALADAQVEGNYQILTGGTTTVPAGTQNEWIFTDGYERITTNVFGLPNSTNNFVQVVDEFADCGFTWRFSCPTNATASGSSALAIYRSYDGGITYEQNPGWLFTETPGTNGGTFGTNLELNLPGVSHLAFTWTNGSAVLDTNFLVECYMKSPKFGAKQATR